MLILTLGYKDNFDKAYKKDSKIIKISNIHGGLSIGQNLLSMSNEIIIEITIK